MDVARRVKKLEVTIFQGLIARPGVARRLWCLKIQPTATPRRDNTLSSHLHVRKPAGMVHYAPPDFDSLQKFASMAVEANEAN